MVDEIEADAEEQLPVSKPGVFSAKLITLLVVVAMFGGLAAAKLVGPKDVSTNASVTATHNDAVADYEAALKTGRPIWVLFHSLS